MKRGENYDCGIANLEENLHDTMDDYREVSIKLDRLRELIINSDVEVIIDNDGKIIGVSKYKEDEPKASILNDAQIITLIVTVCVIVFGIVLLFLQLK